MVPFVYQIYFDSDEALRDSLKMKLSPLFFEWFKKAKSPPVGHMVIRDIVREYEFSEFDSPKTEIACYCGFDKAAEVIAIEDGVVTLVFKIPPTPPAELSARPDFEKKLAAIITTLEIFTKMAESLADDEWEGKSSPTTSLLEPRQLMCVGLSNQGGWGISGVFGIELHRYLGYVYEEQDTELVAFVERTMSEAYYMLGGDPAAKLVFQFSLNDHGELHLTVPGNSCGTSPWDGDYENVRSYMKGYAFSDHNVSRPYQVLCLLFGLGAVIERYLKLPEEVLSKLDSMADE